MYHVPADVQTSDRVTTIDTYTPTVRLDAGKDPQGGGELDWNARVVPDLELLAYTRVCRRAVPRERVTVRNSL